MRKTEEKKQVVTLCKGKMCSDHCRDCTYFDTSRPEAPGSAYYRCAARGSYHKGSECACGSFVRG
ncbi:MAG: hypothetical protein IKD47_02070 [Clostridia bacterium]|nr:hypothetical protein [Clostridia bacterium]